MTKAECKAYLLEEERTEFQGWDFSHLEGRLMTREPDWSYRDRLLTHLRSTDNLLDMGTGGGEFLLTLGHPYEQTVVTEGYPPNQALCRERLVPLGVRVVEVDGAALLPFGNGAFDLVANRHEDFDAAEVWRVLKPGGYFVTQQVGSKNNRALSEKLIEGFTPAFLNHDLRHNRVLLEGTGFAVREAHEALLPSRFSDLGAVSYFAKIIPWEFPGFSVEACFERLWALGAELEENGYIESMEHRFFLLAQKV